MLFLEGVITKKRNQIKLLRTQAPSYDDMHRLVHVIRQRIADYLEKTRLIQRDMDNTFLDLPNDDEDSLQSMRINGVRANRPLWYNYCSYAKIIDITAQLN